MNKTIRKSNIVDRNHEALDFCILSKLNPSLAASILTVFSFRVLASYSQLLSKLLILA